MGRKDNPTTKFTKDKFSQRAKLAGYRARSAYKLLELNNKYDLFNNTKVCIDLCAAPGSWMQIALNHMPAASVCIGVDLHPIKPIHNGITIQGDITTAEVRRELQTNLKSWKADIVIHDGAPNVGGNWTQDAYNQNCLVLHAAKLACEFLKKGGKFVTKVFRSKDHTCVEYVLRKLFGKVEITKPKASREESSEMFIVCLEFVAPEKIDHKFFDPKFVFELTEEPTNKLNVLHPEKSTTKALGYEDGVTLLYKKQKVSEFINDTEYMKYLELANELQWDIEEPLPGDKKTQEIKLMCKDIKLLNRKDLRSLIKWRENMRKIQEVQREEAEKANAPVKGRIDIEQKLENCHELANFHKNLGVVKQLQQGLKENEVEEFENLEKAQKQIEELKDSIAREAKSKLKKTAKRRRKELEKMQLKVMVNGDHGPTETAEGTLFTLANFNTVSKDRKEATDKKIVNAVSSNIRTLNPPKYKRFGGKPYMLDSSKRFYRRTDKFQRKVRLLNGTEVEESEVPDEVDLATIASEIFLAPLVENKFIDNIIDAKDIDDVETEKWFLKDQYEGLETEEVEDFEIDGAMNFVSLSKDECRLNDLKVEKRNLEDKKRKRASKNIDTIYHELTDSEQSDSDEENKPKSKYSKRIQDNNLEDDPEKDSDNFKAFLTGQKAEDMLSDEGLALATKMIRSKKTKRDMIDDSYNRYMQGDEDLPEFFRISEELFNKPRVKVDREDLKFYREKNKDVDARSIKKVVEAKARKARRTRRKMAKINKKIENINNLDQLNPKEKALEIKKLYDTVKDKKKEIKYVVMKKSGGGKPKHMKGPYKMVDRRMKKDKRAMEKLNKKKGKKGGFKGKKSK